MVNIRAAETGTPAFALYTSTAGDRPDTKVVDLSGNSSTAGEQSFTPASATTLSASTKYFIVFSMLNGQADLQRTGSDNIDSGASPGWDIAENSLLGTSSSANSVEIAIKGTAVGGTLSSDATLSALTVTAGGTDLVTFVPGTTTYSATVANNVTEVTVTPTKNDTGATIEYLDGSDMMLAGDDLSLAAQLAVGDTVFKVQVTAEDGTTTETYTVFKVQVTAEDGTTTETYTVTVNRAAADTPTCTLNTGDIWCGVVTPASHLVNGVAFAHGFVDGTPDTGALSDEEFSVVTDGVTNSYTIVAVVVGVGNATGSLSFSLTSGLTAAERAKLVLHVDGSSDQFAFSVSGNPYVWTGTGLDWSSGDPVTLRLREASTPASTDATLSALAVNGGGTDLLTFVPGTTTYSATVANDV